LADLCRVHAHHTGEGAELAPLNNFGAGDIPIDAEKYKALTDAGHKIFHMPFVMGAISFFHGKMVKSSTADKSDAALEPTTIPAALDADWSAASLLDAPGDNSWPMMTFSCLYIRQDMHAMGESGALVQALVKYMYSTEGKAHLVEFGFVSVPKEIVDKAVAAIETVALAIGVVEWAFETEGTTQKYVGQMDHIFSGKRGNYNSYLLDHVTDDVEAQIESLQTGMQKMASTSDILQLHGSGTTNPSKLLWKVMDELSVRAKIPVRLTYRAVGSSTGVAEFVGEGAGLAPLNNFGAGDIPGHEATA
jgi:ABC-type phosphate transport system substrate-binding protein